MNYKDKSRDELITAIKEIEQKHTALIESCKVKADAHKKVLNQLKTSEDRYRRLFETTKDGILILDAETGMINDVNPFLIELLGYSKEIGRAHV